MSCALGAAAAAHARRIAQAKTRSFRNSPVVYLARPNGWRMSLMRTRNVLVGSSLIALVAALGIAQQQLERTASAQSKAAVQAPRFEVDPMWPKPMPNHWLLGNTIGVGID